ncbi:hypothetical protein OH768_41180 [Streptomyces sp. NBC_01622]|uniref:hypothetical protein n=1 Tax=Streptomyces sp. NBC_01622 TaxID=2975903 RepID=UPI00386D504C|nr:hypothetical protein OH768_41180 [Streptomyces sp. NBC_01622]
MEVSLGVRISALCFAGALAIGTAAACGGGDGDNASKSSGGGSDGGTSVAGGTANGGQDGGGTGDTGGTGGSGSTGGTGGSTGGGMPTWKAPDGNGGSGTSGSGSSGGSGGSGGSSGSGGSGGSNGSNGSNGPSGSGSSGSSSGSGHTSGGGGGGSIEGPAWLPPGPHSPNTDTEIDPEVVYDLLGEKPASCADTSKQIPAGPPSVDWRVLRGLAEACKAVQGQGGDWDLAASDYAALQGRLKGCKSGAAYTALGGILRFHGQHPSTTVKLKASTPGGGGAVCRFRIGSVKAGADGAAKPGDTITVTVGDLYFDKVELLGGASTMTIAGTPADLPGHDPDPTTEPPDQLTFEVVVPDPGPGSYGHKVAVSLSHNGGKPVTLKNAFTLVAPGSPDDSPVTSPVTSPSTGAARSR